jgi:hypothetical protein
MFDFTGHPLASINVFNYVGTGTKAPKAVSDIEVSDVTVTIGDAIELPETATVKYNDNTSSTETITWNEDEVAALETAKAGTYTISGTVTALGEITDVTCKVVIKAVNYIVNPSFEDSDRSMWTIADTDGYSSGAAVTKDDPHTGSYAVHFWSASDIDFTVSQEISGLESGVYSLSAYIQGGGADTQDMSLSLTVGDNEYSTPMSVSGWCVWNTPVIENITINECDTVIVSAHVSASASAWGTLDDFELCKTDDLDDDDDDDDDDDLGDDGLGDDGLDDDDLGDDDLDNDSDNDSDDNSSDNTDNSSSSNDTISGAIVSPAPSIGFVGDDIANIGFNHNNAILSHDVMSQFYGQNKQLLLHLGNGIGISIEPNYVDKSFENINFSASLNEVKDFAPGFDTYHMQPVRESELPHSIGFNMNLGSQYYGDAAYIFVKDMTTGLYDNKGVTIVNEIGNIGFVIDEYTDTMVLIAK